MSEALPAVEAAEYSERPLAQRSFRHRNALLSERPCEIARGRRRLAYRAECLEIPPFHRLEREGYESPDSWTATGRGPSYPRSVKAFPPSKKAGSSPYPGSSPPPAHAACPAVVNPRSEKHQ